MSGTSREVPRLIQKWKVLWFLACWGSFVSYVSSTILDRNPLGFSVSFRGKGTLEAGLT